MSRISSSVGHHVRRAVLIALPIGLTLYVPQPSHACSVGISTESHNIPGCGGLACATEIPRNAVFFQNSIGVGGIPMATAAVPNETFFAPPSLLQAGAVVVAGTTTATVGDFEDANPPATPDLLSAVERRLGSTRGCGAPGTCAGVEVLEIEVSLGADDVAGPSALTLLVYFGRSAAEVADKHIPSARLVPPVTTPYVLSPVAASWIAVETMDQAGNRSDRTPAMRIAR